MSDEFELPRVRLAILDDHEVLLDSLSTWIDANAPDFDLVLTASTWLELVHSDEFPTDLVILDFQLREAVSIEARVRTCRAAGAKVIVLSSLDTPDVQQRALDSGVAAFLSKTVPMGEVMDAGPRVAAGRGRRRAVAPEALRGGGAGVRSLRLRHEYAGGR
jgi:DNA-binding NarL/FixJ family response regulator